MLQDIINPQKYGSSRETHQRKPHPRYRNLRHDGISTPRQNPYVKIYFGGSQYRTRPCDFGGKTPSWNETFVFNPTGDSNLRVEVWDQDAVKDDLVGEGTYNLMKVYNMPSMCSDNGKPTPIQNTSTSTTRAAPPEGSSSHSNCRT